LLSTKPTTKSGPRRADTEERANIHGYSGSVLWKRIYISTVVSSLGK
jgi:hypothetical protein